MSFAHDEEAGPGRTGRHMSVSQYANNMGAPTFDTTRRRSSVVPAAVVGAHQDEVIFNQRDDTLRKMSVAVPNLAELTADAQAAANLEHKMGFRAGCKLYPKAIMFSFCLSLAVIMEGYDTYLLGNFFGLPTFARKYGEPAGIKDGVQTYQVSASWQSALQNGTAAAQIIGLMINGIISERIGYRWTMIGALLFLTAVIFITFFAVDVQMLLAGYVLSGLPWGVFQTLTTTYAAEVCPVPLRPYLTTYVNLCWVIGQLLAAGVLKGFVNASSQWAYRVPYAIQWIWPIPIAITAYLAPESPWWLVRHGKLDEARQALLKLTSRKNTEFNVEDTLAMMIHTNELEIQQTSGTSYWDCFRGVDLRRTEVTCSTWLIQQTSGSPMIGWGTYFMIQAGLDESDAYSLGVGQSAMGFCGTVLSWFLMPHFGRRTLYLWGQVGMFIILMIIGGLGVPSLSTSVGWASGALILILTFIYDFTVGPVCYSLVAEIPSTRLRIKTVVLARNVYNIMGIVIGTLQPRMMNPTAWNWRGKTCFFWGGLNLLGLVWTYFRLPEPKGLTYAELDVLFENHVSARKFKTVKVDPFRSDNLVVIPDEDVSSHEGGEKKGY
ncbi:MFS transporter, SP family, general alpha glucoside:H+ symporter [Capronia coronata CBS 617.96]|uniref:MFS transporter, SP family, general alpha glucoside:H+ symporter n=1 Tax=Capronia coronata CBS 617.96 TaxID=1182541 RepID=W9YRP6_9EURO|nr:MFS transporter, SP family, general alpha glucoside:H+ symporter [Capronia coronata CBS 617.96]EXJ95243.1 MFS transporter, SP family, general alpha glucoside:H+ symporter [Capronia coronata CBS 617.96]